MALIVAIRPSSNSLGGSLSRVPVGVEFLEVEVGFHEISPDISHVLRGKDAALRRHRAVQARNGNPSVIQNTRPRDSLFRR